MLTTGAELVFVTKPKKKLVFPNRHRRNICFCCRSGADPHEKGAMVNCCKAGCEVSFHRGCFQRYNVGGFMPNRMIDQRTMRPFCSRHYCTACYGSRYRTRAFHGRFIQCSQCELAWHEKCIPAGSELDEAGEIICPRHVEYAEKAYMPQCAECQTMDEARGELLRCKLCVRQTHSKCAATHPHRHATEDQLIANKSEFLCQWCLDFFYVAEGQFCMGFYSGSGLPFKFYPCVAVANEEYPNQSDPRLGQPGIAAVRWMIWKNRHTYGLLPHSRIVDMGELDFFYASGIRAADENLKTEWNAAQKHLEDPSTRLQIREDQRPTAEQEPIGPKIIDYYFKMNGNKATKTFIKGPKQHPLDDPKEFCGCSSKKAVRCEPGSNCQNRMFGRECHISCKSYGACSNRVIQEGVKCLTIEKFATTIRGIGVRATQDIPPNTFIDEYYGELITEEEMKKRLEQAVAFRNFEEQFYIMSVMKNIYIDGEKAGGLMRYVNHSCDPNCDVSHVECNGAIRVAVFSGDRLIPAGEELTFNYGMTPVLEGCTEMPPCYCGASSCTSILGKAKQPQKPKPTLDNAVDQENSESAVRDAQGSRASIVDPKPKNKRGRPHRSGIGKDKRVKTLDR